MNNTIKTLNCCPVCDSSQSKIYLTHDSLTLRQCFDCELVWWTTPPTREDIKAYFRDEYITDESRLNTKFIDYRAQAIEKIATRVIQVANPTATRLLDVGTASGSFLAAIYNKGVSDVTGVEPSSFAAESVRQRLGFPVHSGFIEDQQLATASFDIVTCLDTLCLVTEPHVDVGEMARVLKPGGSCFIELPGYAYRMAKGNGILGRLLYGKKLGIQLGVHTLYFRRKSLQTLFNQHGLTLQGTMPVPGPFYGTASSKLLKRAGFSMLETLYTLTAGRLEIAPKILYEFRKTV